MIYAGAQKNIGPSGVVVCIVRKSLIEQGRATCRRSSNIGRRSQRIHVQHPADLCDLHDPQRAQWVRDRASWWRCVRATSGKLASTGSSTAASFPLPG